MQVREQADNKGLPEFMGKNMTYILCLSQVAEHESLPPVWEELADAPKRKHLTTLKSAFDDKARWLGVCSPIGVTPGLLKMNLSLRFCLDHRDNLGMGLHQFCLEKHMA